MSAGPNTKIADLVIPSQFAPYVQQLTEVKSALMQSGALVRNPTIDQKLAGGGKTFDVPSYQDLDDDADRTPTDEEHAEYGGTADPDPRKIETGDEIAVRINRNNSWAESALAAQLAGSSPLEAIGNRVADYWVRRQQDVFIATWNGIIKDNAAVPDDAEHVQYDLVHDISGSSYEAGVTDFHVEAFVNATLLMGDSMDDTSIMCVHSIVKARMILQNLIDFIPDSVGRPIPFYQGRRVIMDDRMPQSGGVYDTWLFGPGSTQFGMMTPDDAVEHERKAGAGNGGGQNVLWNRHVWCFHPTGHQYIGSSLGGGPQNGTSSGDLNNAASWKRVYPQRKQIKFVRLVTREHAAA